MDHCASVLLAFPPDGKDLAQNEAFHKAISAHIKSIDQLLQKHLDVVTDNAKELLEVLNPSLNSAAYLTVLECVITSTDSKAQSSVNGLLAHVLRFLARFDPRQIRYVGTSFTAVTDMVLLQRLLPPDLVAEAMTAALLRLDPTGSMLTSTRCLLVKTAYSSSSIPQVLPVIDRPILHFPGPTSAAKLLCDMSLAPPDYISPATGMTARLRPANVMEYDLVCGLCYCSIRDWSKAMDAFGRCLLYPMSDLSVSKLMVEAYKKWILVGVLLHGKFVDAPPHASRNVLKSCHTLTKPYQELASLFSTTDAARLKEEVEKNAATWRDDQNVGLIEEVVAFYPKWHILNLRHIYDKLEISQVRNQARSARTGQPLASDEEAESLVRELIETKRLYGVISPAADGRPACLTFGNLDDLHSEGEMAQEMRSVVSKIRELGNVFKAANIRLATSKEYIRHLQREKKRRDCEEDDPKLDDFVAEVEDEDLMTGIQMLGEKT